MRGSLGIKVLSATFIIGVISILFVAANVQA
ncbi:hypothetical protein J2S05_003177 [Alkalicoccobacillus murimartini]|uniref:Uncharacterized protein n=1 Tax=Alkalicoccobacillus murimartini TaxID=171685 RepID=A0ABT9YLK1_9BACI|nr:hypothetical protein [Alkalicoccobacillus murimartini]